MGASTCGGFRSRSCLLRPVGPPRFKYLGCRATWSPWLLVSRAVASVTFRLNAAIAAAPVRHTLRHPCFYWQKLWLHRCRRCLWLLILSGRSPWVVLPARYLSSAPSPSSQVARWRGGSGAWLPFSLLLFLWGRSHSKDDGKGTGMGLPIALLLFQLEGLPCLLVSGREQWMQSLAGMSVLQDGYLVRFQDSSLPLLRSPVSLRRSGCACLRLRPCGKCLRLCLQKVP